MTELLVLNVAQKVTPAVSLDGSRVHTLIDGLDEFLDGAVVDSQRGHIYWTNMGIRDPGAAEGTEPTFFTRNGSLERVDLEWPQPPHDCCPGHIHHRQAADADFADGKLYWCDPGLGGAGQRLPIAFRGRISPMAGSAPTSASRMTQPDGCNGCVNRWGGHGTCHCAKCHRTFTGLTAFDKHRKNGVC